MQMRKRIWRAGALACALGGAGGAMASKINYVGVVGGKTDSVTCLRMQNGFHRKLKQSRSASPGSAGRFHLLLGVDQGEGKAPRTCYQRDPKFVGRQPPPLLMRLMFSKA